jgi:hypothetical protein
MSNKETHAERRGFSGLAHENSIKRLGVLMFDHARKKKNRDATMPASSRGNHLNKPGAINSAMVQSEPIQMAHKEISVA